MGFAGINTGRQIPLSPRTAKIVSFVAAGVFVLFGVLTIVIAESHASEIRPIPGGQMATGTITSYETGSNCGRYGCTTWWQPTIQFTTASGTPVTFTGPEDQNQEQTGESVSASYDPSNPSDAHDLSANVGSTTVAVVFGALFAAIAVVLVVTGHRRLAGSSSLHAAHAAAISTSDGLSSDPGQAEATTTGTGPPGSWVGNRYIHSRTSLAINGAIFGGILIWLIVAK
jgi:hypothetical protein